MPLKISILLLRPSTLRKWWDFYSCTINTSTLAYFASANVSNTPQLIYVLHNLPLSENSAENNEKRNSDLKLFTVRSINIRTSTQFSSFWLYTPPQWIWNETNTMYFNCRLNLRVSKSGERCRNYNSFYMCLPLFKGPKVMGQLAAQLFHGQVCVIPSLFHLQGADKRLRVHFKCAICIWNLLLSTPNMRSKELSLSVKQAIIRLKNQNKPIREIAKTLGGQINCLEHS